MTHNCDCGKHVFKFNYEDAENTLQCPVCNRNYSIFMDMDEDGNLDIEFVLLEKETHN